MKLSVKYRLESSRGTVLYVANSILAPYKDKILKGLPFIFTADNEFKGDLQEKYLKTNRVFCTDIKEEGEYSWLYVSLYLNDIGNGQ